MNRRQFLKTAAIAGGVLTAPYVTGLSWAAEDAPSERLNVGSIGVGGRGSDIGRQASRLGKTLACADVHRGNAEGFAKAFGGKCEVHEDYRRILDNKDIHVITCGTPDHWHSKVSIDAMKSGKDLYCEKPLTLTLEESKIITKVTADTGRVFQVGTQQRSENDKRFLKAVAIARSGKLGKKLHAISSVGGATTGGPFEPERPPEALNWGFWLGQIQEIPFTPNHIGWNFRWWFECSGGQVTDWGVHHTDIALWALGGDEDGVVEAEGKGQFPLGREATLAVLAGDKPLSSLPLSYNVASTFDCGLTLGNGNTIQLQSKENMLTIEGELGSLKVNRGTLQGKIVDELEGSEEGRKWLEEEVHKLYRGMPQKGHMANFFHCVRTREKPISDVASHVHSVNACHLANIAMLLDRKVKFDAKTYTFPGDKEANRLVRREQRTPYKIVV